MVLLISCSRISNARESALGASDCQSPALKTPDADRPGTQCQGLANLCPAGEAAIDCHLSARTDRFDYLGQSFDRAETLVDHAPAVIGDVDGGHAAIDRLQGVLGGHDPFHDDWQSGVGTEPGEVGPGESRPIGVVESMSVQTVCPFRRHCPAEAALDAPVTPSDHRRIHGHAYPGEPGLFRSVGDFAHPGSITHRIDLEEMSAGRSGRHLLPRGRGEHRAECRRPASGCCLRRSQSISRVVQPEGGHRGEHHRDGEWHSDERRSGVDTAHVPQHPRDQGEAVQGEGVACRGHALTSTGGPPFVLPGLDRLTSASDDLVDGHQVVEIGGAGHRGIPHVLNRPLPPVAAPGPIARWPRRPGHCADRPDRMRSAPPRSGPHW